MVLSLRPARGDMFAQAVRLLFADFGEKWVRGTAVAAARAPTTLCFPIMRVELDKVAWPDCKSANRPWQPLF